MSEPITLEQAKRKDADLNKHARGCKKAIDACLPCKSAIAWYAELPLPLLALVLADKPISHTR